MSIYSEWLAVEDLFLAGLGLDIVGAISLARGLIIGPQTILDLSKTKVDYNPRVAFARASDKVHAEIGVALLIAGFVTQAFGYLVSLGTIAAEVDDNRHVRGGLLALAVGLGAASLAVACVKPSLLKREAFAIARIRVHDGVLMDYPDARGLLALVGERWPARDDESDLQYVERVFRRQMARLGG